MRYRLLTTITIILFGNFLFAQSNVKAIRAGRVIDVKAGTMLTNQIILIEGGKILDIGSSLSIPSETEVIDLSKYTVLPGLIDCHTHMGLLGPEDKKDYYRDAVKMSSIDLAIIVHRYAERTLKAGFTTVRDMGSQTFIDISLRNAINEGFIPGPRIIAAGFAISSTGGHADANGFSPWLTSKEPLLFTGTADGVEEVQKKVRENIKFGADVIKLMASGGVLSEEEHVGTPQYSQEEMNAVVLEANRWNKRVAAHAHGTEAIKMAIKAGVNSIEHGSLIDEEGLRLMKEHGTYLVADIYDTDYILSEYKKLGFPDLILDKERKVSKAQRENFRKAVKENIKIAYGTDAGVYPHGRNAKQFALMVKYGMTPMQAIQAATVNAADLLDLKGKTGSLEKGLQADIVAVLGNPLEDISVLEKIEFVLKEGKIYKNETNRTK